MTYRDKQHQRYMTALKQGHYATAWDALWRAASEANLLTQAEHSHTELTGERGMELLAILGWPVKHPDSWDGWPEYESPTII